MLLLVDEVKKRTQFLNTYIDNLSQSLNKRRYNQALSFINQQRPAINHTNVTKYNPNTFVIDSLKTKNQNLTQLKKQLEKQKALLQKKLDEHNKDSSGIKNKVHDSNIMTVLSKIQITLKDIKRVEYQPMLIDSDYEKLTITNAQDKKTIFYLTSIFQVEKKSLYMLLHYRQAKEKQQSKLWVMMKFSDQNQMLKWYNLIFYGKMVQQAKGKRYLFLGGENYKFGHKEHGYVERKASLNDQSQVVPYSGQIPTQGMGFRGTFVPEKPQNLQKPVNNASSLNHQRDLSLTLDPNSQLSINQQNSLQKHMTHSLLLTPTDNSMTKKVINNYSTFRPTPLNRIRGKSMYLQIEKGKNFQQYKKQPYYNNYEEEKGDFFDNRSQRPQKSSHKNNFRKASQDITLRLKNQSNSQQRKLQKFRSQRNLIDDLLVHSTHVRQPQKPQSIDRNFHSVLVSNNSMANQSISGYSRRIQKQIEKKNEFLQRVNNMNFQNSNTSVYNSNILSSSNKKSQNQQQSTNNNRKQLQTTARWFNEEDLRSQSINSKRSSKKSQFSHNNNLNNFPKKILYNKENKQLFEQEIQYSLEDQSVENYQHNNLNNSGSKKITNNFLQNNNNNKRHHQEDEILEASESHEISPTFPKKIVYEDGSHIRLYPVEFTNNNTNGYNNNEHSYNEPSQHTIKTNSKDKKNNNNKHNVDINDDDEQKDNVFIEPLEDMQQHQIEQSRHGILRNDRLNTLDSQTDKDQHNNTNEMDESNSQDHQEQEFQQLIDQLKKGLILTKCSQGSFWTKEKEIKLSQNENTLLVIDVKDKKIKKLPISDIQTVEYGKFSKGIIKHISQIQQRKCLIINARQGKVVKKLQFVGNNPQKLALFTQNLAYFVEMFKAS